MDIPEIRSAKSGDVHIAYQIVGDGPVDLVSIYDWIRNLELHGRTRCTRGSSYGSARSRGLLLFDKRGNGLSDRTVDMDLFTLEVRMDDVRAVMDAAGSKQAVLFGYGGDGAPLASVFAASIGARVAALADPGQMLVSSTVKDLVAGSGLAFEDASEHELKDYRFVPGQIRGTDF